MTTKKERKFTLDDFIVPTLSDKPTKLFIKFDGKATKEYLLVISSAHADVKRPFMQYGFDSNKLKTECDEIENEVDKRLAEIDGKTDLDKALAASMIVGWSLGEFNEDLLDKLLTGNDPIVQGVIVQSFTAADYIKKK